jgi:hypothetical protein
MTVREKFVVEAKLRSIDVVYTTLKDQTQGLALELSSRKKYFRPSTTRWFP